MPEEPPTPPPGSPRSKEPSKLASSEHPSGDTWRTAETPLYTGEMRAPGGADSHTEVIGDFQVIGRLGQGGMGTVYRARQISLDREVALKLLPAQLGADAEYVARFQREARVAASLHHPNLVRVYSAGAAGGCHYIAMELIEGETLADWVRRGPLPPLEALRILRDVTLALECGWRTAHLIHRDIKPGNIFLSKEGAVKLGDLGLAKTLGNETTGLTQTGMMMGTPHYMSPEQTRGEKDLDFRADVYSLGCTFYQMLSGRTPYSGTDPVAVMSLHRDAPPPAISKVLPQCPIPLARLVGKMMKKQRRERHGSYEELIAQIDSVRALLDPALAATITTAAAALTEAGTQVGTHLRGVQNEAAEGRLGEAPLPKKSRAQLYAGMAAAAVALGIVAYLVWPKEEKLTAAQRWARAHAGEKKAETEQSAVDGVSDPALPASVRPATAGPAAGPSAGTSAKADTMPVITGWQDAMAKAREQLAKAGKVELADEDGWIVAKNRSERSSNIDFRALAGVAVRARIRGHIGFGLRTGTNAPYYAIHFYSDLHGDVKDTSTKALLAEFHIFPASEHDTLITMAGDTLQVWLDGALATTVHDSAHPQGWTSIWMDEGAAVRDLAVAELPASMRPATAGPATGPAAGTAAKTDTMPVITGWQDAMGEAERNFRQISGVDGVPKNGWLAASTPPEHGVPITSRKFRDVAVKGRFRGAMEMHVRNGGKDPAGNQGDYRITFRNNTNSQIRLHTFSAENQGSYKSLGMFAMASVPEHDFLITMAGTELSVWVDGQHAATVHDATLVEGDVTIYFLEAGAAVRDLAVAELPSGFSSGR